MVKVVLKSIESTFKCLNLIGDHLLLYVRVPTICPKTVFVSYDFRNE